MKKREMKVIFFLSFLSYCFKINFGSDLQKLRYQKHMYFRSHLRRVGKLLSVHFHSGELCSFPDIKSLNVLITTESDPSHLLGKKPTLFFLRQFHLVYGYVPVISAAHEYILMQLHY